MSKWSATWGRTEDPNTGAFPGQIHPFPGHGWPRNLISLVSQNQLVSGMLIHISKVCRDPISQGINLQREIQLPDQHISCI